MQDGVKSYFAISKSAAESVVKKLWGIYVCECSFVASSCEVD